MSISAERGQSVAIADLQYLFNINCKVILRRWVRVDDLTPESGSHLAFSCEVVLRQHALQIP